MSAASRLEGVLAAALALLLLPPFPADAQTMPPPSSAPAPKPAVAQPTTTPAPAPPAPKTELERLTQSNQELLDLLKRQQAVLQDIQYDRRLQNRQITLVEERLTEALERNADLQAEVAKLQTQLANMPPPAPTPPATGPTPAPTPTPETPPAAETVPPEPASYLPPPDPDGPPGTLWWHRVMVLSGTDSKNTDLFHIEGRQWRIIWHNQDQPGDSYKNTSALFINAFPRDDTIPQKVCSKLGSGGDTTELVGPGNFYVKVEASGGKWELAVEDFR